MDSTSTHTLVTLLGDAAKASALSERHDAAVDAVAAIRMVERMLLEQLAGEPLRGLKNLGNGTVQCYAARVRGKPDERFVWPADASRATCLIIQRSGQLGVAEWTSRALSVRDAVDSDLKAGDVDDYVRTLIEILPRHIASSYETRGRWKAVRQLANRLMMTLTDAVED